MYKLPKLVFFLAGLLSLPTLNCMAQPAEQPLVIRFNKNVINQQDETAQAVMAVWRNFLTHYQEPFYDNPNWFASVDVPCPNYELFELGYNAEALQGKTATILGIYPVEDDFWAIKTAFTRQKEDGFPIFNAITTVYLKKIQGKYYLFSQLQRYLSNCNVKTIGKLSFYVEKCAIFQEKEAKRLDSLNKKLAQVFQLAEYETKIVAVKSVARLYTDVLGYDFAPMMFPAVQTGGLADRVNNILLSANGSPFYAHELVHFYTAGLAENSAQTNPFFDEGIATLFGGSREKPLDWHWQKLKKYLQEHPEMRLDDLGKSSYAQTKSWDLPDGTYSTDVRYTVAGVLSRKAYEKTGRKALIALLNSGDTDIYSTIEAVFGVKKADFRAFLLSL